MYVYVCVYVHTRIYCDDNNGIIFITKLDEQNSSHQVSSTDTYQAGVKLTVEHRLQVHLFPSSVHNTEGLM